MREKTMKNEREKKYLAVVDLCVACWVPLKKYIKKWWFVCVSNCYPVALAFAIVHLCILKNCIASVHLCYYYIIVWLPGR